MHTAELLASYASAGPPGIKINEPLESCAEVVKLPYNPTR